MVRPLENSIWKSDLETKILTLCERYLGPHGYDTVDVECLVGGRSTVRIFVERQLATASETPEGTSIDDCARASELIGPVLETESMIPGAFDLEVSSPGLDRRLRTEKDFERVVGEEVKIRFLEKIEGLGAKTRGTLLSVLNNEITILASGMKHQVALQRIKRANRVWDFDAMKKRGRH